MLHKAFVALGSNQENPVNQLITAFDEISKLTKTTLIAKSHLYQSLPMGPQDQPNFINAIVLIETELQPHELLTELQSLEQKHHRVRKIHWGPRTLDLDIIFYDNEKINTDRLTVPHPGFAVRSFVLKPMQDIAPDFITPCGKSINEHCSELDMSDLKIIDIDL